MLSFQGKENGSAFLWALDDWFPPVSFWSCWGGIRFVGLQGPREGGGNGEMDRKMREKTDKHGGVNYPREKYVFFFFFFHPFNLPFKVFFFFKLWVLWVSKHHFLPILWCFLLIKNIMAAAAVDAWDIQGEAHPPPTGHLPGTPSGLRIRGRDVRGQQGFAVFVVGGCCYFSFCWCLCWGFVCCVWSFFHKFVFVDLLMLINVLCSVFPFLSTKVLSILANDGLGRIHLQFCCPQIVVLDLFLYRWPRISQLLWPHWHVPHTPFAVEDTSFILLWSAAFQKSRVGCRSLAKARKGLSPVNFRPWVSRHRAPYKVWCWRTICCSVHGSRMTIFS